MLAQRQTLLTLDTAGPRATQASVHPYLPLSRESPACPFVQEAGTWPSEVLKQKSSPVSDQKPRPKAVQPGLPLWGFGGPALPLQASVVGDQSSVPLPYEPLLSNTKNHTTTDHCASLRQRQDDRREWGGRPFSSPALHPGTVAGDCLGPCSTLASPYRAQPHAPEPGSPRSRPPRSGSIPSPPQCCARAT